MAYQVDFTSSIYVRRARVKTALRVMLLGALAAAAYVVYDAYVTYNQPTLNMRLADYELVAHPIEGINAAWDEASKEYSEQLPYYRLVWAGNPTNYLSAMVSSNAPQRIRGLKPVKWTLTTGGKCQLEYRYVFQNGNKEAQANGLTEQIVQAVTSIVQVVSNKVDVLGVKSEELRNVEALSLSAQFQLPDAMPFLPKAKVLDEYVKIIDSMRTNVQYQVIAKESEFKDLSKVTAQAIMLKYLPKVSAKGKTDFPEFKKVINIAEWFDRADQFIGRNKVPVNEAEQAKLKALWNKVGKARLPWERFRALDNAEIVRQTKDLGKIADGVKGFKVFLEKRRDDAQRRLLPLIECYNRTDVGNVDLIKMDLNDRVAKSMGLDPHVRSSWMDEPKSTTPTLQQKDGKYTFSWIRWTFSLGGGPQREVAQDQSNEAERKVAPKAESFKLDVISDCVQRILKLGPGYVLDHVTLTFDDDGQVSGATFDGLLPVKKVDETVKEATGNGK